MQEQIRLQKYLADAGIASRRHCEELVSAGRVSINGKTPAKLGSKVDPLVDKVFLDGKPVAPQKEKIYLKFNKPVGVTCSCRKFPGEKTILDFVSNLPYRLYPIGRLDKDSEGLLLLTNDGEAANRLAHPRYMHEKEYSVIVKKALTKDALCRLEKGIVLDGKKTLPAKVKKIDSHEINITLKEGRKRQIRRMLETLGNEVVSLKRIRIDDIYLDNLAVGKYAFISIML